MVVAWGLLDDIDIASNLTNDFVLLIISLYIGLQTDLTLGLNKRPSQCCGKGVSKYGHKTLIIT